MTRTLAGVAALVLAVAAAPLANVATTHKTMHHHAVHHAKYRYYSHPKGTICKGEFMYMKGGKCLDTRAKT